VEQVGEDGGRRASLKQTFGLEGGNRSIAEIFGLRVEQPPVGAADAIGLQGELEFTGLEQDGQAGQGAFLDRRGGERGKRGPDMLLGLGRDRQPLAREDRRDPVGGPGAILRVPDTGERLEQDRSVRAFGQASAEVVPVAAHRQRGRPD